MRSLARWILSDTLLRTDDDLMSEMRRELGFKRRGSRIDAALKGAIQAVRVKTTEGASAMPPPKRRATRLTTAEPVKDLSALQALLGKVNAEPDPDPLPNHIFDPEPDPKPKGLSDLRSLHKPPVRRKSSGKETSPTRNKRKETRQKVCGLCGRPMILRNGHYGQFLGCSGFPLFCRNTEPVPE